MAKVIKSSGEEIDVRPKNGEFFELEEMQKFVGGWVEILPISGNRYMVVNEEGRLLELPLNQKATDIFRLEPIVGNVLVCGIDEIR